MAVAHSARVADPKPHHVALKKIQRLPLSSPVVDERGLIVHLVSHTFWTDGQDLNITNARADNSGTKMHEHNLIAESIVASMLQHRSREC